MKSPDIAQREGAQKEIIGNEAFGRLAAGALDLGLAQLGFGRADDPARHLVLKLENIVEGAVEAVGPEMCTG